MRGWWCRCGRRRRRHGSGVREGGRLGFSRGRRRRRAGRWRCRCLSGGVGKDEGWLGLGSSVEAGISAADARACVIYVVLGLSDGGQSGGLNVYGALPILLSPSWNTRVENPVSGTTNCQLERTTSTICKPHFTPCSAHQHPTKPHSDSSMQIYHIVYGRHLLYGIHSCTKYRNGLCWGLTFIAVASLENYVFYFKSITLHLDCTSLSCRNDALEIVVQSSTDLYHNASTSRFR
jgi:hypothetical protein